MKTAKLIIEGRGIEELPALIKEEFKTDYQFTSKEVIVILKEKYYLRTGSNLLSVIILNYGFKNSCAIEVITRGGRRGLITSFDWGASGSMRDKIIGFLKELCSSKSWSCTEST